MSDRFIPIEEKSRVVREAKEVLAAKDTDMSIKLPKFDMSKYLPWIVIAGLVVFIVWDRRGPGPDAGIDVAKPVAAYHETLVEALAASQEALADFCEGRNPDATEIIEESKKLASEALRASGKELSGLDNKYLRDGTPSQRVEYLRSLAKELRRYK